MKLKKGFTLTEMVVVFGIIAVITAISVSTLGGVRTGNYLDIAAEEALTLFRDAQNRSISIQASPVAGGTTKAWGVNVEYSTKKVKLMNYYSTAAAPSSLSRTTTEEKSANSSIAMRFCRYTASSNTTTCATNGYADIMFSTPFAKTYAVGYTSDNGCTGATNSYCLWQPTNVFPYDWKVANIANGQLNLLPVTDDYFYVEYSYRGRIKKVVIKNNGSSYVE